MLIYRDTEITKRNYKRIFDDVDHDILDIIRVALADGIDIGPYIDYCLEDPFRLWQIKYCIQEDLPIEIVHTVPYGSILYKIRKMNRYGYDTESLVQILNSSQSEQLMGKILEWHMEGYDLSGMNFDFILDESLDMFTKGFESGYDMSIFTAKPLSRKVLLACFAMLKNGKKIGQYLTEDWNPDVLIRLAQLSYEGIYDQLIPYINSSMTQDRLELTLKLTGRGMPVTHITAVNESGRYICSMEYLMAVDEVLGYGLTMQEILKLGHSPGVLLSYGKKKRNEKGINTRISQLKGMKL